MEKIIKIPMNNKALNIRKYRIRNMFDISFDFDTNPWYMLMDKRSVIEIAFDEVILEINKKRNLLEKLSNFFFKKQTKAEVFIINLGL